MRGRRSDGASRHRVFLAQPSRKRQVGAVVYAARCRELDRILVRSIAPTSGHIPMNSHSLKWKLPPCVGRV